MTSTQEKQHLVVRDLESYKSFFDHDWAVRILEASKGTQLDQPVFDLCEAWKGVANTAAMPWVTVEMVASFAHGFCNDRTPYFSQFLDALAQRLCAPIYPALSNDQKDAIRNQIDALDRELVEQSKSQPFQFDRLAFWNELLGHPEFVVSLLASQRIAYAGVYFAYEHFLTLCFRLLHGVHDYRIGSSFPSDLTRVYDSQFTSDVWSHSDVKIPRIIRHAIAHNGGRETADIAKLSPAIGIIDGALQITPTATRIAFNALKSRALIILTETKARLPK